jgi:hypothetical protein
MSDTLFNKAVDFSHQYLECLCKTKGAFSEIWHNDPQSTHGVISKIVESGGRYGNKHVRFYVGGREAAILLGKAEFSADAWDYCNTIAAMNLMHGYPIPDSLLLFVCKRLRGENLRPKAKKGYANAKRDMILPVIIFYVWSIFDLSEIKAREAVHKGARLARIPVPADLRDIWEASPLRNEGLPKRTPELSRKHAAEAEAHLKEMRRHDITLEK